MRTDDGWLPSAKELDLINNITNFCLTVCDLHLRFSIQTSNYQKEKSNEEIKISRNQEIFLRYPSFFKCIEKYKLDEDHFLNEFQKFLNKYIEKTPLLKRVFKSFSEMKDKTLEEVVMLSVRGFLEPIVSKFTYDQPLLFSHFEVFKDFFLFLEAHDKEGKSSAKKIKKYNEEDKQNLFNSSHQWLTILLICFRKDNYRKPITPAITRENLNKGLKRFFQTKTPTITVKDRRIDYFKEGDNQSLGFIPTNFQDFPNVHPDTIPIIKAGGKMFGSFMSYKLLHFENKLFYDRWNSRVYDFRKASIEGGYLELLRKLGYAKSGKNVENLRKLLYFQAGFWFTLSSPNGGSKTGNLITLTEHKNKFGEIGRVDVIAGSMLTPDSVYSASKLNGGNLLIPFVNIPDKMIGNPATWGSQAFLQMLVLEYLTMRSRELAQKGSVTINEETWKNLAHESNLPNSSIKNLPEIKRLFCCQEQGFLEIQGNECSLNKKNEKANLHLIEQGQKREKQSFRSKLSKKKRKER